MHILLFPFIVFFFINFPLIQSLIPLNISLDVNNSGYFINSTLKGELSIIAGEIYSINLNEISGKLFDHPFIICSTQTINCGPGANLYQNTTIHNATNIFTFTIQNSNNYNNGDIIAYYGSNRDTNYGNSIHIIGIDYKAPSPPPAAALILRYLYITLDNRESPALSLFPTIRYDYWVRDGSPTAENIETPVIQVIPGEILQITITAINGNLNNHPFMICNSLNCGNNESPYENTGIYTVSGVSFTVNVPDNAIAGSNPFYYGCKFHQNMGNSFQIIKKSNANYNYNSKRFINLILIVISSLLFQMFFY